MNFSINIFCPLQPAVFIRYAHVCSLLFALLASRPVTCKTRGATGRAFGNLLRGGAHGIARESVAPAL